MKKIIVLIALLFAGAILVCSSQVKDTSSVKEGWVDDDAYRTTATAKSGANDKTGTGACMGAVVIAQSGVIEKLADAGTESVKGKVTKAYKPAFSKSISGSVKNMKVINQKYYPERRECEVTIEIREKGLKKKVMDTTMEILKP